MNDLYDFYPCSHSSGSGFSGPECKLLISVPHSGQWIPWNDFNSFLIKDSTALRQDVDYAVDQLLDIPALQQIGVSVIVAKIHRTAVDLNRKRESAVLAWPHNSHGITLVQERPTAQLEKELLENYYEPYYQKIDSVYKQLKEPESVPFIDLHSMPSLATDYHLKINPHQKKERPSYCLSDQLGKSCSKDFILRVQDYFLKKSIDATINDPYIGGGITQHYASYQWPNIQIEINRKLYMDEHQFELTSQAQKVKEDLHQLFQMLVT